MDDIELGEAIRNVRKPKGISQEAMGFHLGISQQSYCDMENGKTPISFIRLCEISKYLGVPVSTFIPAEYQVVPPAAAVPAWRQSINRLRAHLSYIFTGPVGAAAQLVGWVSVVEAVHSSIGGFMEEEAKSPVEWSFRHVIALIIVLAMIYFFLVSLRKEYDILKGKALRVVRRWVNEKEDRQEDRE